MTKLNIYILKVLRKLYIKLFSNRVVKPVCEKDPNKISEIIYEALISDKPCMITRFGGYELSTLVNYLGVKKGKKNYFSYIKGNELDWWWNKSLLKSIHFNAGFFPPTIDNINRFCELLLEDIYKIDVLGSWLPDENILSNELQNTKKIELLFLDPFWAEKPWTRALEGKRVLVIHPFANEIETQYEKRKFLFNSNILPEFELKTIKAVQSIAGEITNFEDWFEALDYMKSEIRNVDFDICLIGAGAYGFPLAAYVKSIGKKAVHIGGSLQLIFGIKGKRWENPLFGSQELGEKGKYLELMNDYWVYPSIESKPQNAIIVEGACYW